MTRSTQRDELGVYLTREGIYGDWGTPEKYRGTDIDRLAAYEDTGLDPEEIEQLKRERDKLERFLGELEGAVYTGQYFHLRPMIEKWHGQKEEK